MTAISNGLTAVRQTRNDIPGEPILQGKYGEAAYWFLEMSLVTCASYGPAEGITCVNDSDLVDEFSRGEFTADLVLQSKLTRQQTQWSNIFLNVDAANWQGIETVRL